MKLQDILTSSYLSELVLSTKKTKIPKRSLLENVVMFTAGTLSAQNTKSSVCSFSSDFFTLAFHFELIYVFLDPACDKLQRHSFFPLSVIHPHSNVALLCAQAALLHDSVSKEQNRTASVLNCSSLDTDLYFGLPKDLTSSCIVSGLTKQ